MGRPLEFESDAAVEKAMGLFWRNGYAATTPRELASELGIAKGSLYNTFASKHNLFEIALRRYRSDRLEALGDALAAPGDVAPQLRRAMAWLAGVGAHRRGCFAVNSIGELVGAGPSASAIAGELFVGIEEAFRTAIVRGQESGEIDARCRPDESASALLATTMGLSVLAKAGRAPTALSGIIDATVEGLLAPRITPADMD